MIATALVFLLGALTATLILLLFIPVVWRRAQRLARREFDATIPTSVNEIRAEMDLVRATSAFELRREERRAQERMEQAVRERGEAGRVILENGHLLARRKELEETLAERDKRIAHLDERLHAVIGERDELAQHRQDLRAKLQARAEEAEAFALRHQALKERSEEQRRHIAASEARIAELVEALRAVREPGSARARKGEAASVPAEPASPAPPRTLPADLPSSGSARLRAVLQSQPNGSESLLGPSTRLDGRENAEIREQISDIAALVIQKEIEAEGENSSLRRLIEAPEPPRAAGTVSLAGRVRALLATQEAGTANAAAPPQPATSPSQLPADDRTLAGERTARDGGASSLMPAQNAGKRNGGGRSRPKSRR